MPSSIASTSSAPASLISLIEVQQAALKLADDDLSTLVGFEREISLTLIKAGSMKFPLTKIAALAAALQLDPAELLKVALSESDPVLSQLIEDTFNPLHLSATEQTLIKHLRELSGDAPCGPNALEAKGVVAPVAV